MCSAALVLFCRRPARGEGKRRLARQLGDEPAFAVAEALLQCALEDAAAWPGPVVLSPARSADAAWAAGLLEREVTVIPQSDGNLGERIAAVDGRVRSRGYGQVVFIGSDAPSLHPVQLAAAAAALGRAEVVLMPAADGGVTLMGSRTGWPDLAALPWSEAALGAALERVCRHSGRSVERLASSYDIDEAADCRLAIERLVDDRRSARRRLRELLCSLQLPDAPLRS
ncbi:MAG: TIGR04282 family arsenosugar biosynthesis glycosyltransferase [Steroidobacteraceae bacterium]